ncbi:hypothetical protein PENSPDRAFT_746991 [Peniophora sp. CONT]|nr:hypothetical protein PENSPDRAFT_746991 [Peniophora sp. CONT]
MVRVENFVTTETSLVDTIYGDNPAVDVRDEVRFYVELTQIEQLDGTCSLDIRRSKGNLRSYKFLYDTIRDRIALAP